MYKSTKRSSYVAWFIGFCLALGISFLPVLTEPAEAQSELFGMQPIVIYQKGETAALGGTSTGFVVDTTNAIGTGSHERLFLYKMEILDCNSTANDFIIYNKGQTYTTSTLNNQVLWKVTYDNDTVIGPAVDGLPSSFGVNRIDVLDLPYTKDFTDGNGNPTEITGGLRIKSANGAKPFTAVFYVGYVARDLR